MPVEDKQQPIIVKKVKKGGAGHHGGAWKVAYADFVTAMMAFFLLMWLLGSTDDVKKAGVSDFFSQPSAISGEHGASTSMIDMGGMMDVPRDIGEPITQEELAQRIQEQAQLDALMNEIKERIEAHPTLKDFKDQLKLDITSEGLRIQIVDKERRPMFESGSARLKDYAREILHVISGIVAEVPNHLSVSGHTDAEKFLGPEDEEGYSNWELSSDRANSARRALVFGGVHDQQFGRVVGLADSVLYNKDDPYDPVNRRISIIVLNRATEQAVGLPPWLPKKKDDPAMQLEKGEPREKKVPAFYEESGGGEGVTQYQTIRPAAEAPRPQEEVDPFASAPFGSDVPDFYEERGSEELNPQLQRELLDVLKQ